jgi:TolA-binding protein
VARAAQSGRSSGGSFLGIGGGGRPPPPEAGAPELTPQLLDRVQGLEQQMRELRGRIDEVQNAQQRQYEELSKQIGDLNFRLTGDAGVRPGPAGVLQPAAPLGPPVGNLAAQTPAAPPGQVPASPAVPAPGQAVRRPPELALQEGNAALARRDYAAAAAAANEVLADGKATPRAYDAQFLRAQAEAGRHDWSQAAIAYDDTYNRARTGSHAQDALVGLASALANLNEKKAACETLSKLKAEFPTPRPEIREQAGAVRLRAGCA